MEGEDECDLTVCFICNEDLTEDTVTVTRGLKTLIDVSKMRDDNHHLFLQKQSALEMHRKCRLKYIAMKNDRLNYANSHFVQDSTKRFDPLQSPKRKKRRESPGIDFRANCMFCALPASIEHTRKFRGACEPFVIVRDDEFQEDVEAAARSSIHKQDSKIILERIALINLVSVNARYHKNCRTRFFRACKEIPEDQKIQYEGAQNVCDQMKKVLEYMDETDEQIYNLTELIAASGLFL